MCALLRTFRCKQQTRCLHAEPREILAQTQRTVADERVAAAVFGQQRKALVPAVGQHGHAVFTRAFSAVLTADGAVFEDHERQTAVDDKVGLERSAHVADLRKTRLERQRLARNAHFRERAQRPAVVGVQAEIAVHGKAEPPCERDITQIKEVVDLPVIGIIKKDYPGTPMYITVTMKEVDELVACGVDILAVQGTGALRPDGSTSAEFIRAIKAKYPDQLVMADCDNFENAMACAEAGADFVGTTMRGYTPETQGIDDIDFDFVHKLATECPAKVIAEGHIHYPEQAVKALELSLIHISEPTRP